MLAKAISVSSETKEYDQGFHVAFTAVKQARAQHVKVRPHWAITHLKVTPYLLMQAVLLPLIPALRQTHAAGFLARLHSFLVKRARPSVWPQHTA